MKLLVVIILVFLLRGIRGIRLLTPFINAKGDPPKLVDGKYTVKQVDLLGTTFKSATFTYTFDQPLFLYSPPICPALSTSCADSTLRYSNCFCDYSTPETCGANSCGDCMLGLCNITSTPWTLVPDDGTLLPAKLNQGDSTEFRFLITDPCQGFRFKLHIISGDFLVYVQYGKPAAAFDNVATKISRGSNVEFFSCPESQLFLLGTWFVTVIALDDVELNAELTLQALPSHDFRPFDCALPAEYSDHECVVDSVPISQDCADQEFHYYYFEFNGCQHIMMTLTGYDEAADMDLYGSFDNPTPHFLSSDFSSYLTGDDYKGISVCPPEGQDNGHLFLTVACVQPGVFFSNYTLYVSTNATNWSLTPLTSFGKYEYLSSVVDSANVDTPQGRLYCDSLDFTCDQFWFTYPADDDVIYLPVPPSVRPILPTGLNENSGIVETPKNNTFSFSMLLEYTQAGVVTSIFDTDALSNVTLRFNGVVTNQYGEAIMGGFVAQYEELECNYEKFTDLSQQQSQLLELLDGVKAEDKLNMLRLKIDLLKFSDAWSGCAQLLTQLLTSSIQTQVVNSTDCVQIPGTTEYNNDPCCNYLAEWRTPCFPRPINVSISISDLNQNYVQEKCLHPECTDSFLQDYKIVANQAAGGCSVSTNNDLIASFQYKQNFIGCQKEFDPIICNSDKECGEYSCNLIDYTCLVPLAIQEYNYVQCIVNIMDASQVYYLAQDLGLESSVDRQTLTNVTYSILKSNNTDCVGVTGLHLEARGYWQNVLLDSACTTSYYCSDMICKDKSCPIPDDSCINWCLPQGTLWVSYPSTESACTQSIYCNWNARLCARKDLESCQAACNISDGFCGICENGQDCSEFSGIDETDCGASTVCVLPDGSYMVNITDEECNSYGKCSETCGFECQAASGLSEGACLSDYDTVDSCLAKGGFFIDPVCVLYLATEANCSISGGVYYNCGNLSADQCFLCQYEDPRCIVPGNYLECFFNAQVECTDENSCTNGGHCSSQDLLVNPNQSIYGACVHPRLDPVGNYSGTSVLPFCFPQDQNFPNGCITNYSETEQDCDANGGTWWMPSITKEECEKEKACWDVYLPTMQQEFSPKSEQDCNSEYNIGEYKSMFEWTAGRWFTGQQRKLKWVERKVSHRYSWGPTIDLVQLENLWNNGISQLNALQYKSEALCNTRSTQTLATISCDCSQSSNSNCFGDSIAIPVTESRPCAGSEGILYSPTSTLEYTNNSISFGCTDVLFSQVSALRFQAEQPIRLSANFVTFKQPSSFSIRNKSGEPIGRLLGDGSQISHGNSMDDVIVCLEMRSDLASLDTEYTIYDFATSDSNFTQLVPMGINAYLQDNYICAYFSRLETSQTYFPIIRLENWQNKAYNLFDSTSEGFIYTLAVLFLVMSIASFVKLVTEVIVNLKTQKSIRKMFKLKQTITFFVFLFNFIRSIYFFSLPSGTNDSPVGDYILVVLPTFFFFSAFSTVIVLWAVTVAHKQKMTNRKTIIEAMKTATIIVNIALYIMFIIIVLVFQFSTSNTSVQCGGRVATILNNSKQKQISIAYATIIAAVSLGIGIAFVVFGMRLRNTIRDSGFGAPAQGKYSQLDVIAVVGAVSFILHCAFILIVTSASGLTIVFTFFGLIVTEIIPTVFILGAFWRPLYKIFFSTDTNNSANTTKGSSTHSNNIELKTFN